MEIVTTEQLFTEYQRIMTREAKFNPDCRYWIKNPEFTHELAKHNTIASITSGAIVLGEYSDYVNNILYRLSLKNARAKQIAEDWTQIFFNRIKESNYSNCATETAVIVMATLKANGKWYSWRERAYL